MTFATQIIVGIFVVLFALMVIIKVGELDMRVEEIERQIKGLEEKAKEV